MQTKEWDSPNKMRFNSGVKVFDRQCVICSTGNIIAPTQYSGFIRSENVLECNGISHEPGYLRKFDLDAGMWRGLYSVVRNEVMKLTESSDVILYQFHHYSNCRAGIRRGCCGSSRELKEVRKVIDGYVITDTKHHYLWSIVMNHNYSAGSKILKECLKYITSPEEPFEDLRRIP